MNIAVIGLGIIGGSFCKAIKKYTDHYVIGINRTPETAQKALAVGAIDEIGTPESLGKADQCIETIRQRFGKDSIRNGILFQNLRMPSEKPEITMPTGVLC